MPAAVWYGVDLPHVPAAADRQDDFIFDRAPRPPFVDTLYLALSGYFLGVFLFLAAPRFVPRRRCGCYRLGYGLPIVKYFFDLVSKKTFS